MKMDACNNHRRRLSTIQLRLTTVNVSVIIGKQTGSQTQSNITGKKSRPAHVSTYLTSSQLSGTRSTPSITNIAATVMGQRPIRISPRAALRPAATGTGRHGLTTTALLRCVACGECTPPLGSALRTAALHHLFPNFFSSPILIAGPHPDVPRLHIAPPQYEFIEDCDTPNADDLDECNEDAGAIVAIIIIIVFIPIIICCAVGACAATKMCCFTSSCSDPPTAPLIPMRRTSSSSPCISHWAITPTDTTSSTLQCPPLSL